MEFSAMKQMLYVFTATANKSNTLKIIAKENIMKSKFIHNI